MIFQEKKLLILGSIIWPNLIAWLPFLLEILGNICIAIICCPACSVINFVINHSRLIKPFSYIIKNSGQKCNYFQNEESSFLAWNKKHFSSFLYDVLNDFTHFRHCVKRVQIRSYLLSVFSCIQTTNNSIFGHFPRSESGPLKYK